MQNICDDWSSKHISLDLKCIVIFAYLIYTNSHINVKSIPLIYDYFIKYATKFQKPCFITPYEMSIFYTRHVETHISSKNTRMM